MAVSTALHADEETIKQYLRQNAPTNFILEDSIEFRDFPGQNGGRISVIGHYVLMQDYAESHRRFPALVAELRRRGFTESEIGDALRESRFINVAWGNDNINELTIATPRLTRFPFSAELPYIETVSGISLSGRIQMERMPEGQPVSSFRDHYFVGSPEFNHYVDEHARMIENQRQEKAAQSRRDAAARQAEQVARRERDALAGWVVAPSCAEGWSVPVNAPEQWNANWYGTYVKWQWVGDSNSREFQVCIDPNEGGGRSYVGERLYLTWTHNVTGEFVVNDFQDKVRVPACRDGWSEPFPRRAETDWDYRGFVRASYRSSLDGRFYEDYNWPGGTSTHIRLCVGSMRSLDNQEIGISWEPWD